MTRIIKQSTPGKERRKLSKAIVVTIREFMQQQEPDEDTKDMVTFIILALCEIASGIDQSVAAWEKRGYWVKADKYRLEWQWAAQIADQLDAAFKAKEWGSISQLLLKIMGKFNNIKVSDRHRMGKPWQKAYQQYQHSSSQ